MVSGQGDGKGKDCGLYKANCDIREEIFELASAMHMPILEMHTVVKSLEDVFLELTGEGDEK
jgi:ABC-2 type transport system ATP-binding protein